MTQAPVQEPSWNVGAVTPSLTAPPAGSERETEREQGLPSGTMCSMRMSTAYWGRSARNSEKNSVA